MTIEHKINAQIKTFQEPFFIGDVERISQKILEGISEEISEEDGNLKIQKIREMVLSKATIANALSAGYEGSIPTQENPYPEQLEDFFRENPMARVHCKAS